MKPAPVPGSVPGLDLFELGALIVGKVRGDFLVGTLEDLADLLARFASDLFQLCRGFFDDGRYFGDLFWRQGKLRSEALKHPFPHYSAPVRLKKNVPGVRRPKESAGHSSRDKNQEESRDQFPLQSPVHGENSD
ncbi:MAG: hypothetical protein ABI925_06260 [Verrucomicrobiota bacterium]